MMSDAVAAPLAGRAVLVTGASSGIGRAIALAAARAGADVALTYRANEDGAREVEREIHALGRRAAVIRLDLTDDQSVRALGPAARDALGRLDVWVNNAGADILTGAGASLSDVEKLDLLLAVDLRGTMLASWRAAEMLGAQQEGGVIINMSWDHVLTGMPGLNPQLFAAVKGARARLQQVARALGRAARARERGRAGLDRDLVRRGPGRRRAPRHRGVHAAQAVGHARRRRRRRGVPRIARRGVPDRPDDPGGRRGRDVNRRFSCLTRNRRTTRRRSPSAWASCPAGIYEDGWIRRVYKTDGWPTTLMLVNAIGYCAEAAYHHPDLAVTWGRVVVKLSTHSAGGITDKDFALARRIEEVVLWRPAAGGALTGTPNKFVRSGDPR